jgi:hypothetical protein
MEALETEMLGGLCFPPPYGVEQQPPGSAP